MPLCPVGAAGDPPPGADPAREQLARTAAIWLRRLYTHHHRHRHQPLEQHLAALIAS